jgi:hypothetical protein
MVYLQNLKERIHRKGAKKEKYSSAKKRAFNFALDARFI